MSRFSNGTASRWARCSVRSAASSAAAGRGAASRSRYSATFIAGGMMRYVEGAMHVRTLGLLALSFLLVAAAPPAPSPEAVAAFDRGERALAENRLDQA